MNDYRCGLLIDDLSDHLPCLLSIENLNSDTNGFNTILSRKLTDTKMTNIKYDWAATDWSDLLLTKSCQANYDLFETTLSNILDKHAPILVKTHREKCKPEPWITRGLRKCRIWLRKLYKEFLTHRNDTNEVKYKSYKTVLRSIIHRARIEYYVEPGLNITMGNVLR